MSFIIHFSKRAQTIVIFLSLFIFVHRLQAQVPGLYINEVSQGASGSKEYVELIVVGTPTCSAIPTLDLRGWYIDDNNGNHATGTGTGIATGCVRLSQDPFWSAVPIGTLIVFYNDADLNASIPAQDLSMADGNCRLVIPISNCQLLEKNSSLPSTATATYPTTGFTTCGNWTNISMANSDDSFQTLDPSGNLFHSVSWGNNTLNDIIYFSGTSAGMVAMMSNNVNNNITTQSNWTRSAVAGNETPGSPNNAGNNDWICSMNNGCTPLLPISVSGSQINPSCLCTGSATVNASGGFTGCGNSYTYSWSPAGGNNSTATNLCAGNYTVTVSDINGCTQTQSFILTSPPPFTLSNTQTNVSCHNGNDGSATINPSGGTGPFTYSWAPSGGNNATATGLSAGNYTVTVTDASSCSGTITVSITQPFAIIAAASHTNVSCNGDNSGSATVVASGGTPGYSYSWSPSGGNAATANNLSAGNYTCTITDNNGCTATHSFSITQPPALTISSTQNNISCNGGNDGAASVVMNGGVTAYNFSWSPSGGTNASATSLTAGNYTCTVTDANGCTITESVTLTEPLAISGAATSTPAACGGNNGTATVNATGGIPSYTYSWAPSGGTNASASGLIAGTYTCTITDANGCTGTAITTVNNASGPSASIASSGNNSCAGGNSGTATVTVSSGTGPFSYSWMPSGGTAATASNLSAGNYTCTVTDANGCISSVSVIITEPPALNASGSVVNVLCAGGNNGTASVNVSGGTPGYSYLWSPGGGTNATENALTAGSYTCTITDANGCTTQSVLALTEPTPISVSVSSVNANCNSSDGSATVTASGGAGAFIYSWSPAGGNAATASNLSQGNYTCTITDANGCTTTASVTINSSSAPVAGISAVSDISCNGANDGTANANVTGGSGNYSYTWSPAGGNSSMAINLSPGTYTCTATDTQTGCSDTAIVTITQPSLLTTSVTVTPIGCNATTSATATPAGGTMPYSYSWSSGGTNATENNLAPSTYTVTVTDAHGCSSVQTFTVTPSSNITLSATSSNLTCFGSNNGTATVTPSGGVSPYTYSWSPSGGTNATANGLSSGTYTCTITDANGCTATQTFLITQPAQLTSTGASSNVLCNGTSTGSATVTASGGTGTYTYSWSPFGGTNNSANNLSAGNFTCIITDANGCSAIHTFSITQPSVLAASSGDDSICPGSPATLSVSANGGTAPYTCSWSNGPTTPSQFVSPPSTTTYTVTVTDANGCTNLATATVLVFPSPSAGISSNTSNGVYVIDPLNPLCFSGTGTSVANWYWDLNGNFSSQQNNCFTLTAADTGSFCANLFTVSTHGCTDTVYTCIEVMEVNYQVPNVFTPNADGMNDIFTISNEGMQNFHCEIYDRWGVKMYEWDAPGGGWDGKNSSGKEAVNGVYYWTLHMQDYSGKEYDLHGFVHLIR
jgi:gliding motility-associated-like protein